MTTKALVFVEKEKAAIEEVPLPTLRDDYILIKTTAVAINPTDWKHIWRGVPSPGGRTGCDFAGIVEAVGPKVTKPFKKGDRIAGMTHGGDLENPETGAFAEYIVAKGDFLFKTPEHWTDEQAATLGISVYTVAQGFYQVLDLPLPTEPRPVTDDSPTILINGGSTATGIYGIQFAKLSGLKVIATSSPKNFDYLKSLGADAVFDYNSPTIAEDIRSYTNNSLKLAWDCTGLAAAISAGALSSEGGKYVTIIQTKKEDLLAVNPNVDGPYDTLMYTILGEGFKKGDRVWHGNPEEWEFAVEFREVAQKLIDEGKVKSPNTFVNRGGKGLEGVLHGLDELRLDRVSGGKLVYTM